MFLSRYSPAKGNSGFQYFLLLVALIIAPFTQAQTLTTRYWPLVDGNSMVYTVSSIAGSCWMSRVGEDYDLYFNYYRGMQFAYENDGKRVVQNYCSGVTFSPSIVLLDEALIKGGKITKKVQLHKGYDFSISATATTVIKPCGTVTVPAGTFNNCISVTVILTHEGESVTFESFVLAPKVGIIRLGIVNEDKNLLWLNAVSGYVDGQSLSVLSDTTPPAIVVTSPSKKEIVTGESVSLQGRVSDRGSGVVSVMYQIGATNSEDWQYASGTENWSATITPAPGPVTAYIKAIDAQGNESTPVCYKFFYGIPRLFSPVVLDSYMGKVIGGRQDWSYIGETNVLTAVPNTGNTFLNWTLDGNVISSNKILKFVMPDRDYPNLIANFSDVTSPRLVITSPTNNQRLSNNMVRVTGRAGDNNQIATVVAEVVGSYMTWVNTTNQFTNWWADLPLQPGSNLVRVVAYDVSGRATANMVRTVYIVSDYLTVRSTGSGVLSVNYNHALLEIAKPYAITAKGINGYAFSGWSSTVGAGTNSPRISFSMQSNLVLTATFVDVTRPMVKITTPVPALTFRTNAVVTVTGTATDNAGVQSVQYSVTPQGGEPAYESTASLAKGVWSANAVLTPGSNVFHVRATDAAGNISTIERRTLFYTVYKTLALATNNPRLGSVSGVTNRARLAVGSCTKVTAIPAKNQIFHYWSDEAGKILSLSNSFTYVMPNSDTAVLQANFGTNIFLVAQGTYAGLFFSTNQLSVSNSGSCTFTLKNNGEYSGTINMMERSYPVSGRFLYDGTANLRVARTNGLAPLEVALECSTGPAKFICGEVTQTNSPAAVLDAGVSQAVTNTPLQGKYKLNFASMPGFGESSGTLTIKPNGQATIVLGLSDGVIETVTASGFVQEGGYLPIFSTLYGRRGMILGWLNLSTNTPVVASEGLGWVKLPGNWNNHPTGFNLTTEVEGARW